jgi:hypothetical protein
MDDEFPFADSSCGNQEAEEENGESQDHPEQRKNAARVRELLLAQDFDPSYILLFKISKPFMHRNWIFVRRYSIPSVLMADRKRWKCCFSPFFWHETWIVRLSSIEVGFPKSCNGYT